ncbi:adenylate cyclase [Paraburkholderia acidicola]|uniref:Adenylate cyclase n=1 Tax=Paraburkholderia acidicola TaxID=1912599 RepID=A0ABV1LEU9_9BURK
MNTFVPIFPHSGKTFLVSYGDDLGAINAYSADGKILRYEIVKGPYKGATAEVEFEWTALGEDAYLISWQEADKSTVVHHDDFARGQSKVFFTTSQLVFYRLQGRLEKYVG